MKRRRSLSKPVAKPAPTTVAAPSGVYVRVPVDPELAAVAQRHIDAAADLLGAILRLGRDVIDEAHELERDVTDVRRRRTRRARPRPR